MKRLYSIVFFGSVVFCGAGFTAISRNNDHTRNGVSITFIQPDISGSDQLFKVDSFDLKIVLPSYGVQFYKNGIVFLGLSRDFSKMVPVHVSFGNLQAYQATLADTTLINPAVFSPTFAFPYPCDAISFNKNYDRMYFTKRGKKDETDKIYESDYITRGRKRGSWMEVDSPMDFCTGNSVYTHPSVSTDGKMLVFASDRAGSAGGMDLFVTRKEGEKWSGPENLGKLVNTKLNELSPFLDPSNNLYFSSEGHPGYGGYDVFVCKFNGTSWEEPFNLTKLINSPNDDVAFTLDRENGKVGFYSSVHKTRDRIAQLYKITFGDQPGVGILTNLSDAILSMVQSDTTFLSSRMLIAKAVEPDKTAERAKAAEQSKAEEAARAAERARTEEAAKAAERAIAEEMTRQAKAKAVTVESITPIPEKFKDVIVYRVQFLSGAKQQNITHVDADGNRYSPYVYFYKNEYRYTAGEFTTLEPARELQFALRRAGYPQAFVAAFRNNIRTLDLSLFTRIQADVTSSYEKLLTANTDMVKSTAPIPENAKDIVIYRVQVLASSIPKSKSQITVSGQNYSTFEYYYSGAYRICAGEFNTLAPAREFQGILRNSGYAQAFVVAFRNNVRSLDAALFK